jgi:hypothetical protein
MHTQLRLLIDEIVDNLSLSGIAREWINSKMGR